MPRVGATDVDAVSSVITRTSANATDNPSNTLHTLPFKPRTHPAGYHRPNALTDHCSTIHEASCH